MEAFKGKYVSEILYRTYSVYCICPEHKELCDFCIMYMKLTHMGQTLSVHMIQLKNCWTDLDEIWYGFYAIEGYPKRIFFILLQFVIPTWWSNERARWDLH
jgi:hypothetical protein